jgi:protein involved in polysaccharide export with SLBB domain
LLLGALVSPAVARAQSEELRRAIATRAELEALAATASGADAEAIRERLRVGDFQVGDRIIVTITRPDSTRLDTLTLRAGREVEIPGLLRTSMHGVLRSEAEAHLAREVARMVREPKVEARTLVRISVLGEVARPGFYWMTTDALVSDVIMNAGGPTAGADPSRTVIRRGKEELWDRGDVATALQKGFTLDQLMVRPGDEIVVGRKSVRDSESTLRIVGTVLGLIASVTTLVILASR